MNNSCVSEEWLQLSQKWLQVHRQRKRLEEEEKILREELIRLAGTKNVKGGGVSLTCTIQKGVIEYAKIPELHNVDLDAYRKASIQVWRLAAIKESS